MATITDTLKKPNNTAYTTAITFRLSSPPIQAASYMVIGGDISVTPNAGGVFSVTLLAGDYRVLIGDGKHLTIRVPDTASTYTLAQVTPSDCTLNYTSATPPAAGVSEFKFCADLAALKALIPGTTIKMAWLSSNTADVGSETVGHWYEWVLADASGADDVMIIADSGNTGRWFRRM